MLTDFERGIICLVRSAITNKKADLPECFDTSHLHHFAKMHQIRALVFSGATVQGFDHNDTVMQDLFRGAYKEIVLDQKQSENYKKLVAKFEENGICYMPLKGATLKDLYPRPEMRCMGDIDILVKPEQYECIKNILIEQDYKFVAESDHEWIWQKDEVVTLELHKRLIPSYNTDLYAYFGDGWQRATKKNGNASAMSKEDELVFLFAHFAKHYRDGGIGVKHLVDLWVFKTSVKIDEQYVKTELEKLKLLEFYKNICNVLLAWFKDEAMDEKAEVISRVIIESGAYGLRERKTQAACLRKKDENTSSKKLRKAWNVVFLPYKNMCEKYQYLKKYPILLPIAHIIRIVDITLNKQHNITKYINDIKASSNKKVDEYEKELNLVGLEFDF